ncbi:hypothetical protein ACIRBX_38370 [Kitasatospora sp. NPDC096147]|uniref:hypothetical protein n=1 Tax=Kitasatospora sp. NPDC096147 TaxID=3364093 RepID=UPI003817A577
MVLGLLVAFLVQCSRPYDPPDVRKVARSEAVRAARAVAVPRLDRLLEDFADTLPGAEVLGDDVDDRCGTSPGAFGGYSRPTCERWVTRYLAVAGTLRDPGLGWPDALDRRGWVRVTQPRPPQLPSPALEPEVPYAHTGVNRALTHWYQPAGPEVLANPRTPEPSSQRAREFSSSEVLERRPLPFREAVARAGATGRQLVSVLAVVQYYDAAAPSPSAPPPAGPGCHSGSGRCN